MTTADVLAEGLCWNCSKPYPIDVLQCHHCCASNPNVDMESASREVVDPKQINHAWVQCDDSFDHEYGCEQILYVACEVCGKVQED